MKRFLIILGFLALANAGNAQQGTMPGLARIAGKGIMVFPGEKIAQSNGPVTGYKIERKTGSEDFKEVATLEATKTLDEFRTRITDASRLVPYPIDLSGYKIDSIWRIGTAKGNLHALGLAGISLPIIAGFNLVWLDESVTEGMSYQYRVTPVGNASAFLSEQITYRKNIPVDKLYFSEKEYTNRHISIRFVARIENVPAYAEVYRNDNKTGFKKVPAKVLINLKNPDTMRYHIVDADIRYGQVYEYYLKTFDALGNSGDNSDTVLLGSLSTPKLSMPDNLMVTGDTSNTAIRITWKLDNPELVRSVRLMRSTNSVNGFKQLAVLAPDDNLYLDQSIDPMTPYFYYFELVSKMDSMPKRSTVFAGTYEHNGKPFTAVMVTAIAKDNGNVIAWSYPYNDAAGFYVYRMGPTQSFMQISSLIAVNEKGTYSFTDNAALTQNDFYAYTIKTVSKSNMSSGNSDTVTIKTIAGSQSAGPSAPLNVSAALSEDIVSIFWEDVKQSDESVTGYLVLRKKQGSAKTDTIQTTRNFATDDNIEKGITYTYSIITLNKYGNRSTLSQSTDIAIPSKTILPPAGLRANVLKEGISIQWERPENGENYTYNIYRYTRGSEPKLIGNAKASDSFTDKAVSKGEDYFYTVRSLDSNKKESYDSEEVGIQY